MYIQPVSNPILVIGIRLSSSYALYAVAIEISIMIAIIVVSFVVTKGAAYFPYPLKSFLKMLIIGNLSATGMIRCV